MDDGYPWGWRHGAGQPDRKAGWGQRIEPLRPLRHSLDGDSLLRARLHIQFLGGAGVRFCHRVLVIGDPRDKVAPFNEQKAWADKLAALGHHVQLIEAKAKDSEFHGMSDKAIAAAGMCLSEKSDAEIRAAVESG